MSTVTTKSIEVIKANQFATGAYIASPSFSHYRYSWLRDGTFIAYAMDLVGEHESASRFYDWCNRVILKHENKARQVINQVKAGEKRIDENLFLHTRYTIDGEEVEGNWGNFQLDGYGTWLWGLAEHLHRTGQMERFASYCHAVELTIDYLQACWYLPNYDCWEEFGDRIHPATLAAIYGGLKAMVKFLPERKEEILHICEQIGQFVRTNGIEKGVFVKSIGNPTVDASLLWLALPFEMVDLDDPIFRRTVEKIEAEIVNGHGVHRYPTDVYYGGGQWILLSAWLGWYYAQVGQLDRAKEILAWIEDKCDEEGLPEQVQDVLLAPEEYERWVKQAGAPAHPLLWSHAMCLVLSTEIDKNKSGNK